MDNSIYRNSVDSMIMPQIRHLSGSFFAATFELMKLLPAKQILDDAEKKGLLKPGGNVIESSSGTFALGLALICIERCYHLTIVGDAAIQPALRYRLEDLGVHVDMVDQPAKIGGIQKARLDRLNSYLEKDNYYWPRQYENPMNATAYHVLASYIIKVLGHVDFVVGSVGSGGSTTGTARYLRLLNPDLKLVGVDSINSRNFGRPDGPRLLRGLGSSILPKNVEHTSYDETHWITCAEGFRATRKLHQEHQLYMGPTSGTVYIVGKWLARQHPDAVILGIFPDLGHRYDETIYSDQWLKENDVYQNDLPTEPSTAQHPTDAMESWTHFDWNRRTYDEVMASPRK